MVSRVCLTIAATVAQRDGMNSIRTDDDETLARRNGVAAGIPDCMPDLDDETERLVRRHHRDLLRALDALPEEQRTVLLLVSVEGLPYAEVAAVVGVPLGTVMSRISRGRDRLATLLREGERPRLRSVQ